MDPSQDPLDSLYSYLIDPDSCWQGPYEASTVQDTDTLNDQLFSPFTFETEFDPAVHRPHINVSEYIETADQDIAASSVYRTALNESSNISTVQDVDAISFTPSTPLTPPYDAWTDWLEAPAADLSANTPPYSPIADPPTQSEGSEFICQSCPEYFHRRCDLNKHINRKHNKRAKCPYEGCAQKPFGFEADLQRHIVAKHSAEKKPEIECVIHDCVEKFSRKDNMLRHVKKKHPGNEPSR